MSTFFFYYPGIKGLIDVTLHRLYEFGEYDSQETDLLYEINEYFRELFSFEFVQDNLEEQWRQYPEDFVTYETLKFIRFLNASNLPIETASYQVVSLTGLIEGQSFDKASTIQYV